MSSNRFRLPCLYCKDEVTFDNSQLLKEHLLKIHGELVGGTSDSCYGSPSSNHNYTGKRTTTTKTPPATVYKMSENNGFLPYQSSSLLLSQKLREDASVHSSSSTVDRLNDVISKKDAEIQRLWSINEKNVNHDHVSSNECAGTGRAIDSMRSLQHTSRTHSIDEKVLRDSELLQNKRIEIENNNSKHSGNYLDKLKKYGLCTKDKDGGRNALSGNAGRLSLSLSSNENLFRRGTGVQEYRSGEDGSSLSSEIRGIDMSPENTRYAGMVSVVECSQPSGETVLGRIEDSYNEKEEIAILRKELENEKQENADLKKSLQEASRKNYEMLQSESKTTTGSVKDDGNSAPVSDLDNTKIMALVKCVEEENNNLNMQLHKACEGKKDLIKNIKTMHDEKEKLVEKLKKADEALCKLSTRVSASPKRPSSADNLLPRENVMLNYINKQVKSNLDEIVSLVHQIPTKEQVSSRQELAQFKDELYRVTLLLAEEKMNHEQLKKTSSELEETLKVMSECEDQRNQIFEDLTLLKSKHKRCMSTENALKQSRREKKTLQRKYENLRRKYELLKVLQETLKEGLTNGNTDLPTNMDGDVIHNDAIVQLQNELTQRDLIIKEYECDNCCLMQKLESTSKELDELRNIKRNLESKQEISIGALNDSLKHMNICIADTDSDNTEEINELKDANAKMSSDLSYLKQKISESENEVENLQGKVNELEINKLSNESEIASLREALESSKIAQVNGDVNKTSEQYTTIIESLNLEKDILSSRVAILEGIGEEMEVLRKEKEKLKLAHEELKRKLEGNVFRAKTSFSTGDIRIENNYASGLRSTIDDIEFDANDLRHLNERDKARLQSMLADPLFNPLSRADLEKLNMPIKGEDEISLDCISDISDIHDTSSGEYVQNIHLPIDSVNLADDTIDYVDTNSQSGDGEALILEQIVDNNTSITDTKKSSSKKKKFLGKLKKGKKVKKLKRTDSPIATYSNSDDGGVMMVENLSKEVKKEKSPNKIKRVKFSDNLLGITEENEQESISDDALFKSYYQECLEKEYPVLAENDDEQTEQELESPKSTTSGSLSPVDKVMQGLRNDMNEWSSEDVKSEGYSTSKCDQGYASNISSNSSCYMVPSSGHVNNNSSNTFPLALNQYKFSSPKDFDDFVTKCERARTEFSEKKRDASEALKMLKSLMSKADELKNHRGETSDNDQSCKAQRTKCDEEGANTSDTNENRNNGQVWNNKSF